MTEPETVWDQALYDEIESLLPDDGVIDDTWLLVNEIMDLIQRREKAKAASGEHNGNQ